jgi:hypothetical protein
MRKQFKPGELTPRQKELLLYGQSSLAGRGFVSGDEELDAWTGNRDSLLAAVGSARPHGYFKFELCESTPRWVHEVVVLFARGLLEAPHEIVALAADQPDDLHQEFASPESIRAIGLPISSLEEICRETGHVIAYHAFCRRPALVAKYIRIGAAIREVLRETLVPLIPPNSTQ